MIGCHRDEFCTLLLDLVHTIYEEKMVFQEWADSVLSQRRASSAAVTINWHGFSLLDVVAEVVAIILHNRLKHLAGKELPKSQCGFWKKGGSSDIIIEVQRSNEFYH